MRVVVYLSALFLSMSQAGAVDNLGIHEHGLAQLDVGLEGKVLELALQTPAANLLGFEHKPRTESEYAFLRRVQAMLNNPQQLFLLPDSAQCVVEQQSMDGILLDEHEHEHEHADIQVSWRLSCKYAEHMHQLNLKGFFQSFPHTQRVQVQLIVPSGQKGFEASPQSSQLPF